jgi:hypothetical protein
MAWLWTDTLAALLMEHDGVAPDEVDHLVRAPVAHRAPDDGDLLSLARRLLSRGSGLPVGDGVEGPGGVCPLG